MPRLPEEGMCHGASRVPGGGHEDLDAGVRPAQEVLHCRGQELGAEVLEGAGGAVKQLQQQDVVIQPAQRGGKGESPGHDVPRVLFSQLG